MADFSRNARQAWFWQEPDCEHTQLLQGSTYSFVFFHFQWPRGVYLSRPSDSEVKFGGNPRIEDDILSIENTVAKAMMDSPSSI
jgi:hypothetical protein